jgi:hypothetical protein
MARRRSSGGWLGRAASFGVLSVTAACSLLEPFNGYTGGDGELDGGGDGGGFLAHDSSSSKESGVPIVRFDSGRKDDAGGQVDSTTTAPDAAPSDCPTNVAFSPLWAPPTPLSQGACTNAQATEYATDFVNGMLPTSGSASCDACLQTNSTSGAFGPIVVSGIGYQVNYGGCIANLDNCTAASCCGDLFNSSLYCPFEECGQCSSDTTYQACFNEIASPSGVCAPYGLTQQCADEVSGGGNYPTCTANGPGTAAQQLAALLILWCGAAALPVDSGALEAAPPLEAGEQ